MLVTHWGLSGPVILRLSAWGARHLFTSEYKGSDLPSSTREILFSVHSVMLIKVDMVWFQGFLVLTSYRILTLKLLNLYSNNTSCSFQLQHFTLLLSFIFLLVFYFKSFDHCLMQKNKVSNTFPPQFGLVNRFWRYILDREVLTKPSFVALTYRKTC